MQRRSLRALLVVGIVVAGGCMALPGTQPAADQPADAGNSGNLGSDTRFDGEANANVSVYNGANETWTVKYTIERDGEAVLNDSKTVAPGDQWRVTTIETPGNYTFTAEFEDGPTLSESVRLPRAVGDRRTFVEVKWDDGKRELMIYWEQ